jgi:hypothetical protein
MLGVASIMLFFPIGLIPLIGFMIFVLSVILQKVHMPTKEAPAS